MAIFRFIKTPWIYPNVNFLNIWDWFERPVLQPRAGQHERELRDLVMLYHHVRDMKEIDPENYIVTLTNARDRAEAIDEPWYALFFGFWCCSTLIFQVKDLNRARDLATKLVVESRKPVYVGCPVMGWVYLTLMDVHMKIDPIGYAPKIYESLNFLENEVPIEYDTYCILEGRRSSMAYVFDQVEEACLLAERYLARSEHSNYRKIHANLMLCSLHYELGNDALALTYAQQAEHFARLRGRLRSIIECNAWQALLLFKAGDETQGTQLYRQAAAKMGEYAFTPWLSYAKLIGDFHELKGQPEKAISLYDQVLDAIIGMGQHYDECMGRLEQCRLLGRLGEPCDDELRAAYAVTEKLIDPSLLVALLDRVKQGDFSSRYIDRKAKE
jgi:hypothetical protein